jgi:nucleoid DNA-binding protein
LKPKSLKLLLNDFAAQQEDPAFVEELIRFYWEYLRKAMSNKDHFNLKLKGFGTFSINEAKLNKVLAISHEHLKTLNPKEFTGFSRYESVHSKHQQLVRVKDMIVKEKDRRIKHKQSVYATKSKKNLEE